MIRLSLLSLLFIGLSVGLFAQEQNLWDLKRCIDHALENNIQIKQAVLNVDNNLYNLKQSQSNRLPDLSLNNNARYNLGFVNDPSSNEIKNQSIITNSLSLGGNVTLYAGNRINDGVSQSKALLMASEMDLKDQQNTTILSVVQAYLAILFNQELVESAEYQLATTKERRNRTDKLVRAGTLARADLLDLESQMATDELALVNANNQLELAYLNLQQLLTLDPSDNFGIVKPNIETPEYSITSTRAADIYRTALSTQPNIRAAELRITGAEYGLKVAKGLRLPTLSASYNVNTLFVDTRRRLTGTSSVDSFTQTVIFNNAPVDITFLSEVPGSEPNPYFSQLWDQRNFSFGVNLNVPIFNRGQTNIQIQQAEIQMQNARLGSELQKQNLKQIIQQAYLDVRSSYSTFQATEKQINALETTFQNAEKQFTLGVINSVDYLLTQNNLNRARNDMVRMKYDYIFKTKILDFYEGKPIVLE